MRKTAVDPVTKQTTRDVRGLVLTLLLRRERNGADISQLVRDALSEWGASLSVRERAFLKKLSVGTVERQLTADAVIDRYTSDGPAMKKPVLRVILRMGVYQILFLDGVSDATAVNESVKLVRKRGLANLTGLVNAVLRNIARDREKLLSFAWTDSMSIRWSMPDYLCRLFLHEHGQEETEKIFSSFFEPRMLTIRPVPGLRADLSRYAAWEKALREMTGRVETHPLVPSLLMTEDPGDIRRLPGFWEGDFIVQDAAGVLAVDTAGIRPGDRVLDVCAAPGGKCLYAAALLDDPAQLTAWEISEKRTAVLLENASRMRLDRMRIVTRDAIVPEPSAVGRFDVVICDLPCTGFGVIGRKPEIKYLASAEKTASLVALQRSILTAAASYTRPGGTLLYSTCTVSRAENEENAAWFCSRFPYEMVFMRQLLPGASRTDGFFISKFQRSRES